MSFNHLNYSPDYALPNCTSFGMDNYYNDGTSTSSSPSPIMWPLPEQFISQAQHVKTEGYQDSMENYTYFEPTQTLPIVEFTDLTQPCQENGRRRSSQAKDKQTISSMHMRRRAQNRASQRAFRERKEKHAQDLQQQLDELEKKYKRLQSSYEQAGELNNKLIEKIEGLGAKIMELQGSNTNCEYLDFDDLGQFRVGLKLEDGC